MFRLPSNNLKQSNPQKPQTHLYCTKEELDGRLVLLVGGKAVPGHAPRDGRVLVLGHQILGQRRQHHVLLQVPQVRAVNLHVLQPVRFALVNLPEDVDGRLVVTLLVVRQGDHTLDPAAGVVMGGHVGEGIDGLVAVVTLQSEVALAEFSKEGHQSVGTLLLHGQHVLGHLLGTVDAVVEEYFFAERLVRSDGFDFFFAVG